jgi:hypothetical protein
MCNERISVLIRIWPTCRYQSFVSVTARKYDRCGNEALRRMLKAKRNHLTIPNLRICRTFTAHSWQLTARIGRISILSPVPF